MKFAETPRIFNPFFPFLPCSLKIPGVSAKWLSTAIPNFILLDIHILPEKMMKERVVLVMRVSLSNTSFYITHVSTPTPNKFLHQREDKTIPGMTPVVFPCPPYHRISGNFPITPKIRPIPQKISIEHK